MSQYSGLYATSRWRKLRQTQLFKEPLCAMCKAQGRITEATVVDHIEPHRGDMDKFWHGPFQSLCKRCHDSHKQRFEMVVVLWDVIRMVFRSIPITFGNDLGGGVGRVWLFSSSNPRR